MWHVFGEGMEKWWPRVEETPTGVKVRGLLEQSSTDPFQLQLMRDAGAGKRSTVFRASWHPLDHRATKMIRELEHLF